MVRSPLDGATLADQILVVEILVKWIALNGQIAAATLTMAKWCQPHSDLSSFSFSLLNMLVVVVMFVVEQHWLAFDHSLGEMQTVGCSLISSFHPHS